MDRQFFLILLLVFVGITLLQRNDTVEGMSNSEAIANVASLYNADAMTIGQMTTTGNTNVTGDLSVGGNVTLAATKYINNPGRMHLKSQERIYLLAKNGVDISNSGEMAGTLRVANGLTIGNGGTITTGTNGTITTGTDGTITSGASVRAAEGKNLCIGDTCINEDHLKMLKGDKDIHLQMNGTDKAKCGGLTRTHMMAYGNKAGCGNTDDGSSVVRAVHYKALDSGQSTKFRIKSDNNH